MAANPLPHALEFAGPMYSPIETLPLDGCTWELLTGSALLTGNGGSASLQVPTGARSVLIEAMTADVRLRPGATNAVTAAVPGADVVDGSAPGWVPAGASCTYSVDGAKYLALKSSGPVRLTWFA